MGNKNLCVICGKKPATTDDHIPPKCLFPKPRPSDLITIPACLECNKSTETLDEEFRVFVNVFVGKQTPESKLLWESQTLPTVQHNRKLLQKVKSSFQPGYITSKGGIILGEADLVVWDDSPNQVIEKMIRGLYFYHFDEILADRAVIVVDQVKELTMEKVECVKSLSCNCIADGQFMYRYARANDEPLSSIWLLIFHKNLVIMGHTNSK